MLLHVLGRAEAGPSISFDAPNPKRGTFHDKFNFALLRQVFILSRPELIIEMQGPFVPVQPHLGKSFRPKRKLPPFARHAHSEIIQQQSTVFLPRADKFESPVIRFRVGRQC
jgi:hypothetical protein